MKDFKVASVPVFIPDFNLLGCELDSFMIKLLYRVICITLKQNKITILSQVLLKNLKWSRLFHQ